MLTVTYRVPGKMKEPGVTVSNTHGVDSEAGRLGTVLLQRPGMELRRKTPRNSATLLFADIPWAAVPSRSTTRSPPRRAVAAAGRADAISQQKDSEYSA